MGQLKTHIKLCLFVIAFFDYANRFSGPFVEVFAEAFAGHPLHGMELL